MGKHKGGLRVEEDGQVWIVNGPYAHGTGCRLRFDPAGGGKSRYKSFASQEVADQYKHDLHVHVEDSKAKRLTDAMDDYEAHLKGVKKTGTRSRTETFRRFNLFFADWLKDGRTVRSITPNEAAKCYLAFASTPRVKKYLRTDKGHLIRDSDGKATFTLEPPAVDYHRNALAEVNSFFGWCASEPRFFTPINPFEKVEGEGQRRAGKTQPKVDDARLIEQRAFEKLRLESANWQGALAALLLLYEGPRASELTTRVVDDVDDNGAIIRVVRGKTKKSVRPVAIEPRLQPYVAKLIKGRDRREPLFPAARGNSGFHERGWPCDQVQELCDELGVPRVTAHGLRGFAGTDMVREQGGLDGLRAAQRLLGHDQASTTERSYVPAEVMVAARQARTKRILNG